MEKNNKKNKIQQFVAYTLAGMELGCFLNFVSPRNVRAEGIPTTKIDESARKAKLEPGTFLDDEIDVNIHDICIKRGIDLGTKPQETIKCRTEVNKTKYWAFRL